jgi:hypothetical protein
MESVTITDKVGHKLVVPVLDEEAMHDMMMDHGAGWCIGCGEEACGVEPDARKYKCESCGERTVYGLEELFMRGLYRTKKEEG